MHRNSKVLLILSFCLITTAVLAAGRCVPCKLNHYCIDGLRYQCPANAPVTQGTGAGALNECLTCVQRNGNSANPIYDDLVGDCVSCYEYDSSTPIWDGNACVACAIGTTFNGETGLCETDCIPISTASELAQIGNDENYPLDGSYCLINDISLIDYQDGEGWLPIGNYSASTSNIFSGVFDGKGHVISDLKISRKSKYQGLFGYSDGTIKNLGVSGSVNGYSYYFGIVVGYNNMGVIEKVYATGSAGADSYSGGIAGINYGTITNSYSTANASSEEAGSFVGENYGNISNSYATGWVSCPEESYGAFTSYNNGTIIASYSLYTTNAQPCGYFSPSCEVSHLPTEEMQTPQTFIDAGWDTSIWELVQGQYPKLKGVGGQD